MNLLSPNELSRLDTINKCLLNYTTTTSESNINTYVTTNTSEEHLNTESNHPINHRLHQIRIQYSKSLDMALNTPWKQENGKCQFVPYLRKLPITQKELEILAESNYVNSSVDSGDYIESELDNIKYNYLINSI